jgi:hypothetical protein
MITGEGAARSAGDNTSGTRVVEVEIPRKFQPWVGGMPKVLISFLGDRVELPGGVTYRIAKTKSGHSVLRSGVKADMNCIGEFDNNTIRHTLNDKLAKHVALIRSAFHEVPFPAPLAYLMADYSYVHPGDCYQRHPSLTSVKAVYTIKEEDARCAICEESIL